MMRFEFLILTFTLKTKSHPLRQTASNNFEQSFYFWAKNSFTLSLCTICSLKV